MAALASDLRRQLENVCVQARDLAEAAARSALQKRAVDAAEPFSHFTAAEKELRIRLRARGRQVGDIRHANKTQAIDQLTQELAYEYWHRMLFARFLAENHLLMHPDGVAVSLEECGELAKSEGALNGFVLAARYASRMLPQVFRTDDVLLEIEFAPEQRIALEKELSKLPKNTFLADDSIGWVYQFWQTKRKDEVNESGDKIDGRTLPAVTQLFTEHYMVQFLLHNTIGAWWCARHGIKGPAKGAGVPAGKVPVEMEYLRWRDDGTPAAGKFEGWPKTLKEFTMLDPCCGSGHFLVAGFNLLVPLRMQEENLSAQEACDAVLRDNLFGLELDPRCTQIAAFALALAAWKYLGEDGQPLGYRKLPTLNIACTGIGPQASEEEWLKLAEQSGRRMTALSREPIENGLRNLHALFSDAATLGSLIDPNQLPADMFTADYETLKPYLAAALTAEQADNDTRERAVAAAGMVKAAELLAREYTLFATNVPYLGRGKQHKALKNYCEQNHPDAKADLATCFIERFLGFCAAGGTAALVTPQNWLFLGRYKKLRSRLLKQASWNFLARLGPRAFETISGEVVSVALVVLTQQPPVDRHEFSGLDAVKAKGAEDKAGLLREQQVFHVHQIINSDDTRITFEEQTATPWLHHYVCAPRGVVSGDRDLWVRAFWELAHLENRWLPMQGPAAETCEYGGRQFVIDWRSKGKGMLRPGLANKCYGKVGVAVGQISNLPATIYTGELYDNSTIAIVSHDIKDTSAIWAFCSSASYTETVRKFNQKLSVDPSHLIAVPFDLAHWQKVAVEKYPNGLPQPFSSDPTQWLFNGYPVDSDDSLQVAVARLLGYRWPRQTGSNFPSCPALYPDGLEVFSDKEGIICIPAVRGAPPAADRLLEVLQAGYGKKWSNAVLHNLLTEAGCKAGASLDDWLRNSFFEQHCRRFRHRPFVWHIWDGHKEGFSCLVNYHKLSHKTLENLTYSYLGDWIKVQNADTKAEKVGADLRLAAAQALHEKLKLILVGEAPYDIFARWKPLSEQAIGWNPDLNDGVRMNIRPFVEADILRRTPNIRWTKDRGNEPKRDEDEFPWFWNGKEFVGNRVNDVHLKISDKITARSRTS